jgi:hypothetical protein
MLRSNWVGEGKDRFYAVVEPRKPDGDSQLDFCTGMEHGLPWLNLLYQ